ncbi:MAG TPA: hypothetical protein PLN94_06840 [Thiolinea sp.]|nr:hypothetical protein [Thiolinea sp.]
MRINTWKPVSVRGCGSCHVSQPEIPAILRWLTRFRFFRSIPARIIGDGFGRAHVDTTLFRNGSVSGSKQQDSQQ